MIVNNKEFAQIPTHQMYYISVDGEEVYSTIKNKILKPGRNSAGYKQVYLIDDGGNRRWERMHYLSAETFIYNPRKLKEINHKDGNKDNNRPDNLEWCDRRYNQKHASELGLFPRDKKGRPTGIRHTDEMKKKMSEMKRGERHPKYKGDYVTPAGRFNSATLAGEKNGIVAKTVQRRCNQKVWLHKGWDFIPKWLAHPEDY